MIGMLPAGGLDCQHLCNYKLRFWHEDTFDAVEKFVALAREHGKTPVQLAYGWILHNPVITAPIIGCQESPNWKKSSKCRT